MLQKIRQTFPAVHLIGADAVAEPLFKLADHFPDLPLLQFDLVRCPLPNNSIDIIVMLNVLEHIKDHEIALYHVHRILKPGGIAIIEVPAGPHLYDVYDKMLRPYRRYTLSNLCHLLKQQHFI